MPLAILPIDPVKKKVTRQITGFTANPSEYAFARTLSRQDAPNHRKALTTSCRVSPTLFNTSPFLQHTCNFGINLADAAD